MTPKQKIAVLEKSFERLLSWVSSADSKIGTIFAIDSAMLGVLAVLVPSFPKWTVCLSLISGTAVTSLLISLLMLSISSFPRTKGPKSSLLFFGSIADREFSLYKTELLALSEQDYINDLLAQCHRNAQIVQKKYKWIQKSMIALYVATIPWLFSVYLLYQLKS